MSSNKELFTKSYDAAFFTYAVLKRLESGKVDTFNERLKSQKIQYFAQLFKVSPTYPFSLYLRGPYSSALAHDLFAIRDNGIIADVSEFVPDELEDRLAKLKKFVDGKTNRELELAATLHWLTKVAKLNESRAEQRIEEWKGATNVEINDAHNLLQKV